MFYVFTSDRLVFIGPTLASAFFARGYGPVQVVTSRPHTRNEFLCIVRDAENDIGYLNFYERDAWFISTLCVPWTMYPVENASELLRALPEVGIVDLT